jgi:hypothetical protein
MKKKILIIENNFHHLEIFNQVFKKLFPHPVIFPTVDATQNQFFISDIKSYLFILTSETEAALKDLIYTKLGGIPDYILLDAGILSSKDDDQAGMDFKEKFIDKHYQQSIVFSITGHAENDRKINNNFYIISKHKNGDTPRQIKKHVENYFAKLKII